MTKTSVFCFANSRTQAAQIVDGLRTEGFSNHDISALFPDRDSSQGFAHERHTKAPWCPAAGVGAAGLMGGTLGWLVSIRGLAMPGVGPLVAAGPISTALNGAAVGGIAGALIRLGIPEYEAKRYEAKIKAGKILLSVHVQAADEVAQAKEILKAVGARDIATSGDSSAPEPGYAEGDLDYERSRRETYSDARR